jgi:hypothetical protein
MRVSRVRKLLLGLLPPHLSFPHLRAVQHLQANTVIKGIEGESYYWASYSQNCHYSTSERCSTCKQTH